METPKIGQKIRIVHMEDPYENYDGKIGVINNIDDMGQLHGTWGGLAIIPEVDKFEIISDSVNENSNNIWSASEFYDNHCKVHYEINDIKQDFYIEYECRFTDRDFNFNQIKITKIRHWEDRNSVPRMSVHWMNNWLYGTYYTEIQDGFVHAKFDDDQADEMIDQYKAGDFDVYDNY